jgi:hypothetical protein
MTYRCRCEQCCDDPLPTWTKAWMDECEARWLASLPRDKRLEYFDGVERRRGLSAVVKLRYLMAKLPRPR